MAKGKKVGGVREGHRTGRDGGYRRGDEIEVH